ncbi:hypothetical protein EG329_004228 [Mollisiaceae sp. DMI_Dod_QoI]|nr:hypothetical protein EG329_004228 [Helotiales sp. DMI_Dod_QoI]
MHVTKSLLLTSSFFLLLAAARPMPSPQVLNSQVGESNIWTQVEGGPLVPRMAQMESVRVRPGGVMWTETKGAPITGDKQTTDTGKVSVSETVTETLESIRRMIDVRWW